LANLKAETNIQNSSEIFARKLKAYFSEKAGAIIAYSGGVDSALLAYTAHLALEEQMVAVLADSPSLARREFRFAVNFAETHGIPLKIVETDEMENPLYLANEGNRCYYCKKSLFEKLEDLKQQIGDALNNSRWPILYGVNTDDLGDHRPGIQAAKEASILAPYVDIGMDKNAIRAVCAHYDLEIAEKPAMPCMSSRISYGEKVTVEKLSQVERGEDFLYDLGLSVLRVRHHGDTARIEVSPEDFHIILDNREKISRMFHDLGFVYISLDLDGFKSGSLNAVLDLSD
jgi:uncharacterized protein